MLKNSKFVLFLSPQKVGQAGNFWTLLCKYADWISWLKEWCNSGVWRMRIERRGVS